LNKSAIKERLRSLYGRLFFGLSFFAPKITFRAFLPDSFYIFNAYPESTELYFRWIHNNKINNAGDLTRFYSLVINLQHLLDEDIKGDFAELGVYQGTTASVISHFAKKANKTFFLFDTFLGFDQRDLVDIDSPKPREFADTSYEVVSNFVGNKEVCEYCIGYFPESVNEKASHSSFAFVHLDCDLYKPMSDALKFFWPRLSYGGMLFLHDYSSCYWDGATKAIDEFCQKTGCFLTLMPDKSGTAVIRKQFHR
jgi:hypothetical protein